MSLRNVRPRTISALVKLAIFIVVTSLLTAILAFVIGDVTFSSANTYHAVFTDATGLTPGNGVRIAGVRVGEVTGVRLYHVRDALVTFTVDRDVTVPANVIAEIQYRNLIGDRYVSLVPVPGTSDPPLRPGATIPLSRTEPALNLTVLLDGFKPLFQALTPADVNRLSYEIIQTLQGEGGTIDSLLASAASLSSTIADRNAIVGEVIDNLGTVLQTVNVRDTTLSQLILQLERYVYGLAGDRTAISDSLANINSLAASTASLLSEARPPLHGVIGQLGVAAAKLNAEKAAIQAQIQLLPTKLADIIRTGDHGSWFNFYLCSANAEYPTATGEVSVPLPANGGC